MKNILSYKKEAVYFCKSKEEQMMLADYMVQICGFRPISNLNEFALYPAFSVNVQGNGYDTLIQSIPKYSPVFKYDYNTLICKTLDEFMEFLDYNNLERIICICSNKSLSLLHERGTLKRTLS